MKLFGTFVFLSCILWLEAIPYDTTKSNILPAKNDCGFQKSDFHEDSITSSDFPWVVYVPLESRVNNPDAHIRCAGALISKRYVAIAKSCLQFVLTKVHIGQHDTTKDVTCVGGVCVPVLEFEVEKIIVDDNKNVVLLRLNKDVTFSDTVRPICLPFDDFDKAEEDATVFTSGWGLTSLEGHNSETKKIVKGTLVDAEECKKSEVNRVIDSKTTICVEAHESSVKPCSGDEGSPVMFETKNKQWILEGVLTELFDSIDKGCAVEYPAGGFRINDEVLQWMLEKMEA